MSTCTKYPIATKRDADEMINAMNKRSSRKKVLKQSYKCDICGFWHTTSSSKKEFRAKVRLYDQLRLTDR